MIAAVIFDLGGVVLESPLHAITAYERARGLPLNAINRAVGDGLRQEFDVFVESAAVGLRKPDPRIYDVVCRELGVAPARAVFLDDIGRNLKPARALGMATIKVDDPVPALRELGTLLGLELVG